MNLKEQFEKKNKYYVYSYDKDNKETGFCQNYVEWLEKKIIKDSNDFNLSVEPAIRYLLKNHNPHTKIIIDYDNAELLSSGKCHNLKNEIPD